MELTALAQAFAHDYESPHDLYRSVYKHTDCGPTIGFLGTWMEYADNGEGGPHNPGDTEREFALYNSDLNKLGTSWYALQEGDVDAISVSSIVEGVDQTTETHYIQLEGKDAETIRDDFFTAVAKVNEEADAIWNDTHGCEGCYEYPDGEPHPIDPDCSECHGEGVVI